MISPSCFLSLVLHRYFSPAKANTARRTCASIPAILFMWTLVLSCVCECTNRCLCTTSSLYVQRSAQNHTTTQSKQIFHQASVTFLDLQFKIATRPLLFSRHPIPWAIAKYTPCEPYTTYFDRPNQSTLLSRLL